MACGHFEKDMIGLIVKDIDREFHYPVLFMEYNLDLTNYYNPGRRQYDANRILKLLSKKPLPDSIKIMGLFRVDLFIPILTYIFGQATLNGKIGMASLYRLRNELYGLEPNHALLTDRFRKVVIHEFGHTFGLIHCQNTVCVMRSSTYVEDIDQKTIHFCKNCQNALSSALHLTDKHSE